MANILPPLKRNGKNISDKSLRRTILALNIMDGLRILTLMCGGDFKLSHEINK
jgi:hypothetical protein